MLGLVVQSSDPPGPGERRQEDSKIKILPCASYIDIGKDGPPPIQS